MGWQDSVTRVIASESVVDATAVWSLRGLSPNSRTPTQAEARFRVMFVDVSSELEVRLFVVARLYIHFCLPAACTTETRTGK